MYFYQLEPSCTRHRILGWKLDSGRIYLVFLRKNCCLAVFRRLCACHFVFFFNAFSRTFEHEWFPHIFQKIKFQFKIWQTFIFCKFVHFQGDIFASQVTFLVSRYQQVLLVTHVSNILHAHVQVQFHSKYSLFDSQSDREFTFSYAIL